MIILKGDFLIINFYLPKVIKIASQSQLILAK